jgi:hypothetical protein
MITLALSEQEAALFRDMLQVKLQDLQHELHHTKDRSFKQLLKEKEALLEHLLHQLPDGVTLK